MDKQIFKIELDLSVPEGYELTKKVENRTTSKVNESRRDGYRFNYDEIAIDPDRQAVKYANKAVIMKMFTLSKATVDRWLSEMRASEFSDGVLNPTYKIVLINVKRFEEFCIWKDETRFKRRK